jgi:hypothetical protein
MPLVAKLIRREFTARGTPGSSGTGIGVAVDRRISDDSGNVNGRDSTPRGDA